MAFEADNQSSEADRPSAGEAFQDLSSETSPQKRGRGAGLARKVGIYGPRNAGKTCYLATALLGMSSSPGCSIVLADEHSRELLFNSWAALDRGEVPPATELLLNEIAGSIIIETQPAADNSPQLAGGAEQDEYSQFTAETASADETGAESLAESSVEEAAVTPPGEAPAAVKRRIPFRTADFGGRLCERGDTGAPRLTAEFNQWLENADCLLFFLAVDQLKDPQEAEERLLEVDAVLNRLLEIAPPGQAITRPLAVLITKWDLVSDLSGTPEEEQQKLREFLVTRAGDLGRAAVEKIGGAGSAVAIFPVSTFGGHIDGRPINPLKPFNLHQPLIWALQEVDNWLWEKAEREAQAALSGIWKRYPAAIHAYQRLIDDYGIVAGPIYDKAQGRIQELKRQAKRCICVTLGIAFVLPLLAIFYCKYNIANTTAKVNSLQSEWKRLTDQRHADVDRIDQFLRKLTAEQRIVTNCPRLLANKEEWQLLTRLDEMTQEANDWLCKCKKFDSAWDELTKRLDDNQSKYEQALEAIDAFVQDFPPDEYPMRGPKFCELNKKRQEIKRAIDERDYKHITSEFEELKQLAQQPGSLEQVKEKAKSLRETFASYRKAVGVPRQYLEKISAMEAEVYNILDHKEWQVVELFKKNNPESFQACAEMAKEYLDNAPDRQRLHKEDAEKCIRECLNERWKQLYEAFYDRAKSIDKAEKLSDAEIAANEAINWAADAAWQFNGYMPDCDTQQQGVKDWLKWSQSLAAKHTRDLEVTVDPTPTERKVWFQLLANDAALRQKDTATTKTIWFSEKTRLKLELPVQDFKSSPCKIQVLVTVDALGPRNSLFKSDEAELLEVLWGKQGRVIVEAKGYGTDEAAQIIFELASPALTPPPLPEPQHEQQETSS